MNKRFFYIDPVYFDLINIIFVNIVFFTFYKESTSGLITLRAAIGTPIVLLSFYFESKAEKTLESAHAKPEEIKKLITSGIYSKIRHPIYLGRILLNVGFLIIFPIIPMFFVSIAFILIWYLIALYEEKVLVGKFTKKYKSYKKRVPMLVPKKFSS